MISKTVSVTKAVAAAGNYSAEDVISESATVGTTWIFRGLPGSGYIVKAQVICETTGQVQRCTLYLFDALPTSQLSDNLGNTAPIHADMAHYLGRIDFPAMEDLGGDSEAVATPSTVGNLTLAYEVSGQDRALYGILVTRDAFTNETATDDYTVVLTAEA